MKKSVLSLLALAVLALAGCFTPPTQQEYEAIVAQIGYGSELPADWQQRVKQFLELRLKDPSSAVYKFDEHVIKSWAGEADGRGTRVAAGHVATVLVNAKNSYGGYTGFEKYSFIIRDGEVIAYDSPGHLWQLIKPHVTAPRS